MMKSLAEKLEIELDKQIRQRNTVKSAEFAEYLPLFSRKHDPNDPITIEQLSELSQKFQNRFSLYHPIVIVDESGEVELSLPPVFTPAPSLDVNKVRAADIVQAMDGAMTRADPLRCDIEQYRDIFISAMDLCEDKDIQQKYITEFERLTSAFIDGVRPATVNDASIEAGLDFD